MVDGAERNREFVADLKAEPSRLRVAHMVRVRGRASADEARLAGDKAQMLFAANSLRFAERQNTLVDLLACAFALTCLIRFPLSAGAACVTGPLPEPRRKLVGARPTWERSGYLLRSGAKPARFRCSVPKRRNRSSMSERRSSPRASASTNRLASRELAYERRWPSGAPMAPLHFSTRAWRTSDLRTPASSRS